ERLGKALDAERPLEDQVTSFATRPRNSRAKAKRLREEHAQKQLVIDELVAKQTVLPDSLAEADAEVARLEVEVQRLGADRAPPPAAGKPTLHELMPKFTVNAQQLGELAVELGLGTNLQTELETAAKVFGGLHELPQVQALAGEAARNDVEIDIDLMESAELRGALEAAGLTQPDEATDADMRVAHKRVLDSHAAAAHKRKKKPVAVDLYSSLCVFTLCGAPAKIDLRPIRWLTSPRAYFATGGEDRLGTEQAAATQACQRVTILVAQGPSTAALDAGDARRQVAAKLSTVNPGSHGPLLNFQPRFLGKVAVVQETRVVDQRLGAVQSVARDAGWHGLWAPAEETGGASAASCSSGVCVLAPANAMVTMPPNGDHAVFPRHAVAAHVHWGVPGGLIVIGVRMVPGIRVAGANLSIPWALAKRVAAWNARGLDWIIGGDWNADAAGASTLATWVGSLAGTLLQPSAPTCVTSNGVSTIDYFSAASNLASHVSRQPE
ncbi:unnamed protein product, partial [Prorocentrum cordatum]